MSVIPQPTAGRLVQEVTLHTLAVGIDGHHVVYIYDDEHITLSITPTGVQMSTTDLADALRGRATFSSLAIRASVSCGGGSGIGDYITTHGSAEGIVLVRTAIPDIYAELRDPAERATTRSIYRRLAHLAERPSRGGIAESVRDLERGVSLDKVAADGLMASHVLRDVITRWAEEQHRFGHVDDARLATILALVGA